MENKIYKFLNLNILKKNSIKNIFKKNEISSESKIINKEFPIIQIGDFVIKLVKNQKEIKKVQSLRYDVFYKEQKAKPTIPQKFFRLDYDKVDQYADHLVVIDKNSKRIKNKIVGTYRLLRGDVADNFSGFYTSTEFNLNNLLKLYKNNQILELGRSCVHKDYRNGTIVNLLWKAVSEYIKLYDIKILLGCASFPGTNVMKFSQELSFLRQNFFLPQEFLIESLDNKSYPVFNKKTNTINNLKIFAKLPPLIKGYLRVGGKVSDSFFIDHHFNTIDLCVVVKTDNINEKYKKKFLS